MRSRDLAGLPRARPHIDPHVHDTNARLKSGRKASHRARRGGRRARRTLVCGPARKKKETSTMAEKAGSVERRAGRSPSRRAQRSDFTLSQLNRAVIRLPPHAQEPLDDRVDVETRASHLRLVSRASVYPFKPKAESLPRPVSPRQLRVPTDAQICTVCPRRLTLRELVRGVRRFSRPHALTSWLDVRDEKENSSPRAQG